MARQPRQPLRIRIDTHTQHRLEALLFLLQEDGLPTSRERVTAEALLLGLDLMLGEALEREGLSAHHLPNATGMRTH